MARLSKCMTKGEKDFSFPEMYHYNPLFSMSNASNSQQPYSNTGKNPAGHTLHYVLVLDRSGSMTHRMDEVRHAVNNQIATLSREAEENGHTCLLSVVVFDDKIETIMIERNIAEVTPLTHADVKPRGTTALVDATVLTIEQAAAQVGPRVDGDKESLAIVVYTDGGENASRHRTQKDLIRVLETYQNLPGWDITFIGASPEAFSMMERAHFRADKMLHIDASDSAWAMHQMTNTLCKKMHFKQEMTIRDIDPYKEHC